MNPSTVSGCIVTYNNMDTIDSAVSSLLEHTKLPFRLYAVDNGSADSTPEHLRSNYPDVEVIETGANLGFGAGHNAFFTAKDGRLMTSFHVQTDPEHPSGDRRVCIGEVRFREENGVIYQEII